MNIDKSVYKRKMGNVDCTRVHFDLFFKIEANLPVEVLTILLVVSEVIVVKTTSSQSTISLQLINRDCCPPR